MFLDVMFIHKEENNDIALFKKTFQEIMIFEENSLCLDGLEFHYSIQESETQKSLRLKISTLDRKSTKKEFVITEAEMIISSYINKIEEKSQKNQRSKIEQTKKVRRLKNYAYISSIIIVLQTLLLMVK